jgi:hypothetical protein
VGVRQPLTTCLRCFYPQHRIVTLASPHLGIVNLTRMWHLEWLSGWIGSWMPSRTIRQLLLQDPERLLYRMATEPAYIDAWRMFTETHLYANVHHDHLVRGGGSLLACALHALR